MEGARLVGQVQRHRRRTTDLSDEVLSDEVRAVEAQGADEEEAKERSQVRLRGESVLEVRHRTALRLIVFIPPLPHALTPRHGRRKVFEEFDAPRELQNVVPTVL